jgi:hypothetical protein
MKIFGLYLWVALAALFFSGQPLAQTNNEVYENACGRVGDALPVLEQFFSKWNPRRAELNAAAARNYLAHHGIEDGTARVFVFQSPQFPVFAVVAARPVNEVICVIRIKGRVHQEYLPADLQVILKTENGAI